MDNIDDQQQPHPILSFFVAQSFPPLLAASLIGLPSCALYITQVVLVLTNWREFNSSFFQLFVVRAIPSIWNMFSSYCSFRIPMLFPVLALPIYRQIPRVLLRTFFFSSYYTYHVENASTMFLILNRLTSICAPFRHEKIWRIALPFSIALILLLPLPLCISVFFEIKADIIFLDAQNVSFSFLHPLEEYPYSRGASISAVLFFTLCTLLNLTTIFVYQKFTKKQQSKMVGKGNATTTTAAAHNNNRRQPFNQVQQQRTAMERKMEWKLTTYALITFFCQISMGFCFLSMFITQHIGTPLAIQYGFALFNFYALTNDVCTLAIPAWSMLWASTKMQQLFAKKWRNGKRLLLTKIIRRQMNAVGNGHGAGRMSMWNALGAGTKRPTVRASTISNLQRNIGGEGVEGAGRDMMMMMMRNNTSKNLQ